MCNQAVNTSPSTIQFVPECYKTQKMCVRAATNDLFTLKYYPDRQK